MLADIADGKFAVDMVADPIKGNLAVISITEVPAARRDVEDRIHERMKAFAVPYAIRWTA